MQNFPFSRLAPLSFAVGVLASGLAPPALAQTESYITDADEAAACEGVCNTYVPPQTEEECRELHLERFNAEYSRHYARTASQSILDITRERLAWWQDEPKNGKNL